MRNVTIKAIQVNSKKSLWTRYPSDSLMTARYGEFGMRKIPNGGFLCLILSVF